MAIRTIHRLVVAGSVAALASLAARTSHASDSFPAEIRDYAGMSCPPPCTICHETTLGGAGTTRGSFAAAMVMNGLMQTQPETVRPALTAVELAGTNGDGDDLGDVAELRAMRNPLISSAVEPDEIICGPTYGCGARVAPRPPVDGSALAFALVVAGYLALRSRKRV